MSPVNIVISVYVIIGVLFGLSVVRQSTRTGFDAAIMFFLAGFLWPVIILFVLIKK